MSGRVIAWNLVERFFAEITDKRIRRGTFRRVGELVRAILDYIRRRNRSPQPLVWTAAARSIARKVRHCNEALETGHNSLWNCCAGGSESMPLANQGPLCLA